MRALVAFAVVAMAHAATADRATNGRVPASTFADAAAPAGARVPAPGLDAPTTYVIARVLAPALAFGGIDLAAARRSPALTAALDRVVRELGLDPRAIAAARSLVVAGIPGIEAGRGSATVAGGAAEASRGALAFGAAWLDAGTQQQLARLVTELGSVTWLAGTVEASEAGFTLAGSAAFADPYAAARIGVSFAMLQKLAATQLPAAVARAVDKLSLTAVGSSVWIRATWTEADLAAMLAML